jgi:hypothetical protein
VLHRLLHDLMLNILIILFSAKTNARLMAIIISIVGFGFIPLNIFGRVFLIIVGESCTDPF